VELRRRNLIRCFPHRTPLGLTYDSGDFGRCLDTALALSTQASSRAGWFRGTGVALFVERAGGLWESAEATVASSGAVVIASSSSPHGQGHETTFAQIAAERLELDPERIELRFGDSENVPPGVGTFGSRSVAVAGSAVALACDRLLELAREKAAERLGVPASAVRYARGRWSAGGGGVTLAELAAGRGLRAAARFESETVFSSGAYTATVEVEAETGRLMVRQVAAVDDAGTIVNPLLAAGQVMGGVAQGVGECLLEEVVHDADGQIRNASLMDYLLPSAAEMPEVAMGEVSTPTPLNPLGAKGVGEGGAIGSLAAVACAVADALGGRPVDPPFTPEKLWRALRS
jgi:carbon-monoxide dehydrogenase large subunit